MKGTASNIFRFFIVFCNQSSHYNSKIRSSTSVPISGGECSFTRFGFRELFTASTGNSSCLDIGKVDIFNEIYPEEAL